jgi:RimJ/RimL family protein N-acetyltransferase
MPRDTTRLRFRLWEDTEPDIAAGLAIYGDPEVMRYVGTGVVEDREKVRERIARRRALFEQHGYTGWAIVLKDDPTDTPIGSILLTPMNQGPHADAVRRDPRYGPMVEVGYHLGKRAWGHGYAREGAQSVVQFAFDAPPKGAGLDEVVATIYPENLPSIRTAESLGFVGKGPGGQPETISLFGRTDIVLLRLSKDRWASTRAD